MARIPGGRADILLPRGAALAGYLEGLAETNAFPDEPSQSAVSALAALGGESTPLERGDAPLIGLVLSGPQQLLPNFADASGGLRSILQIVLSIGARPVLIPPRLDVVLPADPHARRDRLAELVGVLDGLIGLGGDDVAPELYGAANTYSERVNMPRDRSEMELVLAASAADVYMFGICRSHQLWNVARRGALIQDIEHEGYSHITHDTERFGLPVGEPLIVSRAKQAAYEHRVVLSRGSQAAAAAGVDSLVTNARHHQAVKRPGEGLRVTGVVPDDVTMQHMIEVTEDWHTLTVQFHPENMEKSSPAYRMLAAGARRAHVFHLKKTLEARGEVATVDRLIAAMKSAPCAFDASDQTWVRTELARHLAPRTVASPSST